ncbi:hypothetical protein B0H14DRAFT_2959787 [Mycena olivaceomarginata]|nr:hypothetical protein B0H14DRAFT_2959787 [Mycena olivaceomarginata]
MRDVYHKLNQAKEFFNQLTHSKEIIACERRSFDLAKITFQECLHSIRGTDNEVESFCLERLADITAWPSSEWQFRWPVTYLGHTYKTENKLVLHKALLCLGDVFIVNKDGKTTENLYMLALEGFTQMDIHHSRAQCMICLGDLANKQGHTSKAISLWQTAQPLFERSFQATDVTQIDWLNTGSSEIQLVESAHLKGSEGVVSVLMPC